MKFGAKLVDQTNISHFTQIVSTIAKLCSKTTDKVCVMRLTIDKLNFIFAESCTISPGSGKSTFWMSVEPHKLFDLYICEGKSAEENFILLELQPDSLQKALKSSQHVKNVRLKLTKKQTPCLTLELDLPSVASRTSSRTVTHDISVKVISARSFQDFDEPTMEHVHLSMNMPPLKLLRHMMERMKYLADYICLKASQDGDLTVGVETDLVNVNTYFKALQLIDVDEPMEGVQVRLNLKRLFEFINALQFQPTKFLCNFVDQKYAHFFVVHDDDTILQFLIASVLN